MSVIWVEILIIMLLIFFNGIFAMSEFAVVSARKARLQQLADVGCSKAGIALELANAPGSFLSTIQIGISLIGMLAGAYGGATVATALTSCLEKITHACSLSQNISLGFVVIVITYLSLIVEELVPKRIALNNPERIAMMMAKPKRTLSTMALPLVH